MKKNNYLNSFKLNKKITLIIGGNGLIGKEITKAFIDAGSKVVIIDKIKKKFIKNKKIYFVNFDCKNYENFNYELNKIKKNIGAPDIYVNASYPSTKDWANNSFENVTIKSFRDNIDLQLNSYSIMAKNFADFLKKNKKKGSIIQISSIYGLVGQNMDLYSNTNAKNNMIYPIIKGGINNFSKHLASYYGKYNIRVNNICPGGIISKFKGTDKKFDKNFLAKYKKLTLLKRFCRAEDVANAALFLGSDASSYITGTDLKVDGGWTAI